MVVIGAGAWGTAFASRISAGHPSAKVFLWSRNTKLVDDLIEKKTNEKYLKNLKLCERLRFSSDLQLILRKGEEFSKLKNELQTIVFAVPVSALAEICEKLKTVDISPETSLLWLCKGVLVHEKQITWPSQLIEKFFPNSRHFALSGPSFAQEVAAGLPFALTCAGNDLEQVRNVSESLKCRGLRIYSSDDLIGVQLAGAMKNVLAIAAGICDGMNLGLNARASLITRGLSETARLGVAINAKRETFLGLAALGDLILTSTGNLSRNRKVGLGLANGQDLQTILKNLGHVAEGVSTAPLLLDLAQKRNIEVPITKAVCDLLIMKIKPEEVLKNLLSRDFSDENL
ncbi:MAG: hypothetical protein CBD16_00385 [Betaproteobacteria bacterium TMED156]|nr:MAG: hypothetical protein CBD16_00385 [Betaproteobacteria bacterium TMED156]